MTMFAHMPMGPGHGGAINPALATRMPALATNESLHPALGGGGAVNAAAVQSPSVALHGHLMSGAGPGTTPHPGVRPYDYFEEEQEKEYTDIFPQPKGVLGGNQYLAPHLVPMGTQLPVHSTGHTRGLTGNAAAHQNATHEVHLDGGAAPTGGCLSLFPFARRSPPPPPVVAAPALEDVLQQQFDDAVCQAVRRIATRTPEHLRTCCYAYYKQATLGDAPPGGRPAWIHQEDRKMYDAWAKQKGMCKMDAMRKYIDTVNLL